MSRYFVERRPDHFEDIGADSLEVLPCGALWFLIGEECLAIAPGQWVTVCEERE